MKTDADALIIGGGPAGAAAAIGLAGAGWRVSLVEQHIFPRQKVCGECIAAGNFQLLDELGVGQEVRRLAGPELKQTGWMNARHTVVAAMPRCATGTDEYGRALGRDVLDALLLQRAGRLGVKLYQPARVRSVQGRPGEFRCDIVNTAGKRVRGDKNQSAMTLYSSLIIDARGSWESGPRFEVSSKILDPALAPKREGDLFAFKASFAGSRLDLGFLPVIATAGGYGGMVVANDGRTTVALCLRRDVLRSIRARYVGLPAGLAVENHLRETCPGVKNVLLGGQRQGAWLTVGPIRPGIRLSASPGIYRVGNAAGETHPLVGEGISMALQSARMLVASLLDHANPGIDAERLNSAHHMYANAWRAAFVPRLRFAAVYARIAMRPALSAPIGRALRQWPALLTTAARFAGKARPALPHFGLHEETV
jgi:flavin-dependent dehydrogenase